MARGEGGIRERRKGGGEKGSVVADLKKSAGVSLQGQGSFGKV